MKRRSFSKIGKNRLWSHGGIGSKGVFERSAFEKF